MSTNEKEPGERVPFQDWSERWQKVSAKTHHGTGKSHGRRKGGKEAKPITTDFIMMNISKTPNGCWEWMGRRLHGYGRVNKGKYGEGAAHRLSWKLFNGEIPNGLFVLHRCNNRPCCNPGHLYLGDQSMNIKDAYRDGLAKNQNTKKTCCPKCNGPYTPGPNGKRYCTPCHKNNNREYARKKRASQRAMRAESGGQTA